jgi:hypothetical protein
MTDISNLEVHISQFGKKWLAATNGSPYFCFEADSEKALIAKLRKLVSSAKRFAEIYESRGREQEPQPFSDHKTRKILVRELGAVRKVVGIRGAISSNLRLSDQAARSIG